MRRERVTVTVPAGAMRVAEREVKAGKAPSISAWVGEAMEQKARRESLKDLLAEIRQEIGPPTEDETDWARSVLGL